MRRHRPGPGVLSGVDLVKVESVATTGDDIAVTTTQASLLDVASDADIAREKQGAGVPLPCPARAGIVRA